MDKEQAIDLLDNLIGMIEDNQDNDYDTALRMAIEALKAQLSQEGTTFDPPIATDTNVGNNSEIPNSWDCISRQAAIDALAKIAREKFNLSDGYNHYLAGLMDGELAIKNLPPVQPEPHEGHWIPVTNGRGGHECDRCHEYAPSYQSGDEHLSKYCPECGAKMKGATT